MGNETTNETVNETTDLVVNQETYLDNVLESMGVQFSADDQLKASYFLSTQPPALMENLLTWPNKDKLSAVIQFIDNTYYSMQGASRAKIDEIKLMKSADKRDDRFRRATFKVTNVPDPLKEVEFLPLFAYNRLMYWDKEYVPGEKPICSTLSEVHGLFNKPSPYAKECGTCPFKQWGVTPDGKVDPSTRTRPLCRREMVFIGVTPKLDSLYTFSVSGFCMGKDFEAHSKLITSGRMLSTRNPKFTDDSIVNEQKNFRINVANVDANTSWLTLGSQPIKNQKGEFTSAGTVVNRTTKLITKEEHIYIKLLSQLAFDFISYEMQNFQFDLVRTNESTLIDTTAATIEVKANSPEVTTTSQTDVIDDIDVD